MRKILGKAQELAAKKEAERLRDLMGRDIGLSGTLALPEEVEVCDRAISAHDGAESVNAIAKDEMSRLSSPMKVDDLSGPGLGSLSRLQAVEAAEEPIETNHGFTTLRYSNEEDAKKIVLAQQVANAAIASR